LQRINPNAKVLTMGDLNDGPYNSENGTAQKPINGCVPFGIYNPLRKWQKRFGDYSIPRFLGYFDQIMVSQSLVQQNFLFNYWKAGYTTSFFEYKLLASTKDTQTFASEVVVSVIIFQFIFI
jgi:hypothetical protein